MTNRAAPTCVVQGATGRMGRRIIELLLEERKLTLVGAVDRPDHARLGDDVGAILGLGPLGVPLARALNTAADVVIDFSTPAASAATAELCRDRGIPLVVGTTGFEPEARRNLEAAAARIPLFLAPNMSKAVNLLMKITGEVARAIGADADIEIIERHHHFKKDAPSGTAVRLAEIVASAVNSKRVVHGRSGITGERPRGEIGVHALRVGDNPGEHTVVFGLMGETIELTHRALNRDGFAKGAIDAALFIIGKPPRLYSPADLLAAS